MLYRSVTLALLLGAAGAQAESASKQLDSNKERVVWTGFSGLSSLIEGSAPVRPRRSEAGDAATRFEVIPPSVTDGLAEELERRLETGVDRDGEGGVIAEPVLGDEVATIR